jgi:FAD/FMN-containing dehydrogenase
VSGTGAPGGDVVWFQICYSGPKSERERILNKIRSAGTPVLDDVKSFDYVALQKVGDSTDPRAFGSYTKSGFIAELSSGMLDAIIAGWQSHPGRQTNVYFQHGGGAIGRVPADATAFPHRHAAFNALLLIAWPAAADPTQHIAWLREYWAGIEAYTRGFYTNEIADEAQAIVDENYMGNYGRLLALKNKYDPTNLFRLNANIVPTA